MAAKQDRLRGLIAKSKSDTDEQPIQKGQPYSVLAETPDVEQDLRPEAGQLRAELQQLARAYVGARRRSGEALLEAARWLNEARTQAQHGEWQIFLDATSTTADTAERLINIYRTSLQNPAFSDAVRRNILNQSVAALLARPSTPPDVLDAVLQGDTPPNVDTVRKALKQSRQPQRTADSATADHNPQIAEFAPAEDAPPQNPQIADFAPTGDEHPVDGDLLRQTLREATQALEYLALHHAALPGDDEGQALLARIAQAVEVLRR